MTARADSTWRLLALRANFHLATARLLIDLALDGTVPEPAAHHIREAASETHEAQALVRQIAGVP